MRRNAALVVLCLVVIANTAGRSFGWRYDLTWAIFQHGFVTVLLCPLLAGLGAYRAVQFRLAVADRSAASGREVAAKLRSIGSCALTGLTPYILGLVAIVAVVANASFIDFGRDDLLAFVGPVLMICAAATVGWCFGWFFPRWWVAPLIATAWFAGTIALYTAGAEVLVRVGGATSNIAAYHLQPRYVAAQAAWLGSLTLVAALLPIIPAKSARIRALTIAVGCTWILTAGWIASNHAGPLFEIHEIEATCGNEPTPICLYPGFEKRREYIAQTIERPLSYWHLIAGPHEPIAVTQRSTKTVDGRVTIEPTRLTEKSFASSLLGTVSIGPKCNGLSMARPGSEEDELHGVLFDVMNFLVDPDAPTEEWIRNASFDELIAGAQGVFRRLRALCADSGQ